MPEEALELLAEWVAFSGLGDRSALLALQAPGFEHREVSAAGAESHDDRTRRLLVCGDPEMWAVDGGYDVELSVLVLATDGVLRSGRRRLAFRRLDGDLQVTADTFEVQGEWAPPDPLHWPHGIRCNGGPVRGCLYYELDRATPRRLPYPRPSAPTGAAPLCPNRRHASYAVDARGGHGRRAAGPNGVGGAGRFEAGARGARGRTDRARGLGPRERGREHPRARRRRCGRARVERRLLAVRGASITRAHALGRPMHVIAGDAARIVAVGPRGAVSIGTPDAGFTNVQTHITAPPRAIAIDGERIVVAGAGGTVVVIEGGVARALPRRTVEDLVDVRVMDGVTHARTDDGGVVRLRDGTVEWRYRHLRPEHALATMRWAPDASLSFEPLSRPLAIALDEPGAVLPYEMIASQLYRHRIGERYSREPGDRPAIAVETDLDTELERPDAYCCEGDGGDYDSATGVGDAEGCIDEPEWEGCMLSPGMMLGLDPSRGVAVRIARAEGASGECEPLRVEEVRLRDSRVVRSSDVYDCGDGQSSRDRALWQYLGDPRFEAFDEWTERAVFELPGADDRDVLALHRTSDADEILLVQEDNRRSATLLRIPRRTGSEGWGRLERVFQSEDGAWTWLETTVGGEELRWMGATPPGLRDPAQAREDVSTCSSLVVADPDGETTLRSMPTSRSAAITTLPNGTALMVRQRRERWIEALPPHAGWVYEANVRCR